MTAFSVVYTSQTEWSFVRDNGDGSTTSFGQTNNREMQELRAYVGTLGKTLLQWFNSFPLPAAPTVAEQGLTALQQVSAEYAIAQMVLNEFGDATRMNAVKAKIATWKNAHPGVIP